MKLIWVILAALAAPQDDDGKPAIALRTRSVNVEIEAYRKFDPYRVPMMVKTVRIEIDGMEPFDTRTDERGIVTLPLHKLWKAAKRNSGILKIRATVEKASGSLDVSWEESQKALQAREEELRADLSTEENALALLDLVPGDAEGLLALARAYDRKGDVVRAILAYREVLISGRSSREAKERIAELAKKLKKPLPVPQAARDFAQASVDLANQKKYGEMAEAWRAAQKVAPWWEEAYYRAALARAAAWLAVKCDGDIDFEDFEIYFRFDDRSERARELRKIHDELKKIKETSDALGARWEKAKKFLKENNDLIKAIFKEGSKQ